MGSGLIPMELQRIIDKVSGLDMSVGRKGQLLTQLGGTIGGLAEKRMGESGASGRAGLSMETDLEKQRMNEKGEMERAMLGVEANKLKEAGEDKRLGVSEAGSLKRETMKDVTAQKGLGIQQQQLDITQKAVSPYLQNQITGGIGQPATGQPTGWTPAQTTAYQNIMGYSTTPKPATSSSTTSSSSSSTTSSS